VTDAPLLIRWRWDGADDYPGAVCLTSDENKRAAAFIHPEKGRRFAAFRARLRELLGRELGLAPAAVVLEQGRYGRPELAGTSTGLHFNLAHSGPEVVYAFSRRGPIGVDLELQREISNLEPLLEQTFSRDEAAVIRASSSAHESFFRFWTAKEAVMKAAGMGMALSPKRIRLTGSTRIELETVEGMAAETAGWRLQELAAEPGISGHLCLTF